MALWSGKISLGWHFGFPRYDPDTVRPSDRTRLFIFYFQQGSYSVRATRKSRRNVWRYGQGVSPKPCGATSRLSTSDQKWRNVSSLPRLPPREGLDISPLLILGTTTYTGLDIAEIFSIFIGAPKNRLVPPVQCVQNTCDNRKHLAAWMFLR